MKLTISMRLICRRSARVVRRFGSRCISTTLARSAVSLSCLPTRSCFVTEEATIWLPICPVLDRAQMSASPRNKDGNCLMAWSPRPTPPPVKSSIGHIARHATASMDGRGSNGSQSSQNRLRFFKLARCIPASQITQNPHASITWRKSSNSEFQIPTWRVTKTFPIKTLLH